MTEKPNPWNDPAMQALHTFLGEWIKKYELSREKEQYYLALMLVGRMEVAESMRAIQEWKLPEDFGDPIENIWYYGEGKRWENPK
jgi:hypothetical protein